MHSKLRSLELSICRKREGDTDNAARLARGSARGTDEWTLEKSLGRWFAMTTRDDYIVGYIGGSGRSGSTILDMMLGANSRAISTGQLDDLRSWNEHGRYCTCGHVLSE
jgi:hypothetical protein